MTAAVAVASWASGRDDRVGLHDMKVAFGIEELLEGALHGAK